MHWSCLSCALARPERRCAPLGAGAVFYLLATALVSACSKVDADATARNRAPSVTPPPLTPSPTADSPSRVAIPEGSFNAGTEPGRDERRPELEPRLERTTLGPFEIDVRPYPGAGAAQLGWPRARAREACEARRGRLCTELEWERACKGPESQRFAGSAEFDPVCDAAPEGCSSGFAVFSLGQQREWTASELAAGSEPLAAVRGAEASGAPASHRCAHRSGVSALEAGGAIGFRCCYGPPNAPRVQIPVLGPTFEKLALPLPRLTELLAASPITAGLTSELDYFPEASGPSTVLGKGSGDRQGFAFTESPLLWNPVRGAGFLVVSARSGGSTSFVVVFHALQDGDYRLASSFVMEGEPGPIALAYNGYIRPRLHFSSCWGCPGETGKILYREPDSAIVLQP